MNDIDFYFYIIMSFIVFMMSYTFHLESKINEVCEKNNTIDRKLEALVIAIKDIPK